jgi:hypothetical protein
MGFCLMSEMINMRFGFGIIFIPLLRYYKFVPAPRFRGDKFTPAKAGAGMTLRAGQYE